MTGLNDMLFRYRYVIAVVIVFVLVGLNISGSSIGAWANYIGQPELDHLIFGMNREIRSDEWAAFTPFAFSQAQQVSAFPYFNDSIRATATDMFIIYGQPVWHWAMIFRPAQIGYLFLSVSRGLSFFWVFRTVWLFMSVFELGRVLTKDNRRLAVILSILITFSPVVQWWFAINGLVEMLATGSMAIVFIHHYVKSKSYLMRLCLALGLSWVGGTYILTFYPAWQVPFGYVFLMLAIFVIWDNAKRMEWSWKKDSLILIGAVFAMLLMVGLVFWQSKDTLKAVLNTVYPGKRVGVGGAYGGFLLDSPLSIAYGFTGLTWERGMNVMYDFLPLVVVVGIAVLVKTKDKLLGLLFALNIVFFVYITFGVPTIFAKLTLLSYTIAPRVIPPFGVVNLLILIRVLSLAYTFKTAKMWRFIAFVLAILASLGSIVLHNDYFEVNSMSYKKIVFLVACSTLVLVMFYDIIIRRHHKQLLWLSVVAAFFFGAMVNPVRRGATVVESNQLVKAMKRIDMQAKGVWVMENENYPTTNAPLLAGVSSINVTNTYPNLNLWEQFDNGKNEAIYNRYAHIKMRVEEVEGIVFELPYPDTVSVIVSANHLKQMNVRYVVSRQDLTKVADSFKFLEQQNGFNIYELVSN